MQVRLHGSQWTARLRRDLVEAQLGEVAEGDRLAIRLVELRDSRSDGRGAFGAKGRRGWIEPARHVDGRRWVRRVDPRDVAPTLNPAQSDPHRDSGEPGAERALSTPPSEALERGHERLLGRVLGLVDVAEDTVTGADDGRRFTVDQDTEGLAIPCEDGVNDSSIVVDEICWRVGNGR